jgi:hypothetical protein
VPTRRRRPDSSDPCRTGARCHRLYGQAHSEIPSVCASGKDPFAEVANPPHSRERPHLSTLRHQRLQAGTRLVVCLHLGGTPPASAQRCPGEETRVGDRPSPRVVTPGRSTEPPGPQPLPEPSEPSRTHHNKARPRGGVVAPPNRRDGQACRRDEMPTNKRVSVSRNDQEQTRMILMN